MINPHRAGLVDAVAWLRANGIEARRIHFSSDATNSKVSAKLPTISYSPFWPPRKMSLVSFVIPMSYCTQVISVWNSCGCHPAGLRIVKRIPPRSVQIDWVRTTRNQSLTTTSIVQGISCGVVNHTGTGSSVICEIGYFGSLRCSRCLRMIVHKAIRNMWSWTTTMIPPAEVYFLIDNSSCSMCSMTISLPIITPWSSPTLTG